MPPMDADGVRQGLGSWASWQQPQTLRSVDSFVLYSRRRRCCGPSSSSSPSAALLCSPLLPLRLHIVCILPHHAPCARNHAVKSCPSDPGRSVCVACITSCVPLLVIPECLPGLSLLLLVIPSPGAFCGRLPFTVPRTILSIHI